MTARKTAIITGSTSGIGLAIAHALAAEGCNIVVNSFSDTESDHAVAREIAGDHGVEVIYVQADMSKPAECRALVAKAAERFGSVDILVNNAGIQHVAPVEDFPIEKWDAIIAINLSSAFHTIAAAIPLMKKQGRGRIVNIASAHGLIASPFKSAYVSAKHGIMGLTKTVALEVATFGITCNAICPGWVLTPLVQQQIDKRIAEGLDPEQASAQLLAEKQPSGEFVTPQQLGEMALFLCSDAAAQVRGAAWNMDGGWVAQ